MTEIGYLSGEERRELLETFNDTAVSYPADKTIVELFGEQVERTPDRVAVVDEGEEISYRELDERSNQLGHYLRERGVGEETLVPICIDRSVELIVGILGILKAGGAYVPIDPGYPEERMRYMVEDAGGGIVVTTEGYRGLFRGVGEVVMLDGDEEQIGRSSKGRLDVGVRPDHLAYVIYTSGSTGKPKGVMVSHRNLCHYISYCATTYFNERGKAYRIPLFTSLSFDLTMTSVFGALLCCGELIVYPQGIEIQEALEDIFYGDRGINFLKCTPAHVDLLGQLREGATQIDQIILGGEELKSRQVDRLQSINPLIRIYNEYGPTEATVGCVVETISGKKEGVIAIGKPISNTRIYILDGRGELVPVGVKGEIYVGGVQVARGYLNRAELTAERFIADPFRSGGRLYRTGDLGRWLEGGNIEYLGRGDDQVKVRGYRIELGEVEQAMRGLAGMDAVVVVAREGLEGQRTLVGYFTSAGEQSMAGIRSALLEQLPEYMVPGYFVQLERLPLTANGKVDKKALPSPEEAGLGSAAEYKAPRNITESKLVELIASILNKPITEIGIEDNFFDIGANSLTLIKIIGGINKLFNKALKVVTLFQYPTIKSLVENSFNYMAQSENNGNAKIEEEQRLEEIVSLFEQS